MSTAAKKTFLSKRGSNIGASITMEVTALANQLKSEGKPVIGLSAGEPDFDTPDYIKQAGIKAINEGHTKYTAASGMPSLKKVISDKLEREHGLSYTPDQIVVSCGAKHSIFNIMMAVINDGDEVIIPQPYWVSYPDQVKMAGGVPVFIETDDSCQFKITPDQLRNAITPSTKLLILNSPSNPTGMVYTKDELLALSEVIIENNILVISDEIYEKLIYEGEHTSIAGLSGAIKDLAILVNGASKAYSMTGWRIGYTASSLEIAKVMGKIQSHSTSNPATPAQFASLTAFECDDTVVNSMKESFLGRRDLMIKKLNEIQGITCLKPDGAFYAFPKISSFFGKRCESGEITDSVSFCKYFLKEKLVACVPGSGFGSEGYIRLSYAASVHDINTALSLLDEWVCSLK
ncbi:aspartate aminotransferase [Candidatus Marinamargulisbacteria bacterium SCGC AAA071-K20]|nr:aspartate aminotransferase [Candidatus Marinamargulisbacteria bacterium SCGC AAA071-K20]